MPENTIREQTFCCGGGAGLGTDENMEMRLRGGLPRGNAVRYVQEKHGVNQLAAMCAIDRATLVTVCDYWAPGVKVTGISELVANAMVLKGEKKRTHNLRLEPIPGMERRGRGRDEEGRRPAMNDKAKVIAGLVDLRRSGDVSDLVHAWGRGEASPAGAGAARRTPRKCVEDTEYMTANHMDLLNQWRDAVVREGEKEYTSILRQEARDESHANLHGVPQPTRETFCNRCHDYANVEPPAGIATSSRKGS